MTLDPDKIRQLQDARKQIDRLLAGQEATAPIELPTTSHKALYALLAGLAVSLLARAIDVPPDTVDSLQGEIASWLELLGPPIASAASAWLVRNQVQLPQGKTS